MYRRLAAPILLLIYTLVCGHTAQAPAEQPDPRVLIVFDCSNSMWGQWSGMTKMEASKNVTYRLIDSLMTIEGIELALRTYGNKSPHTAKDCQDTKLEIGFAKNNGQQIKDFIKGITPTGTTPIAYSLTMAANDFPSTSKRNIIILVTDGIEECEGDPCAVSQSLQSKKVILKPFIIGVGLSADLMQKFDCVGRHYSLDKESDFRDIVNQVVNQVDNSTTFQVLLNDAFGKPVETDVNMTFYNAHDKAIAYNFYHTMKRGVPDTFIIDPFPVYNVQINTLPPVFKSQVMLRPREHNIIRVDVPQGEIELAVNPTSYARLQALIYKNGTTEIINVHDFNTKQKYLTGTYDVQVLTVPKLFFNDVKVEQSKVYRIDVPEPGKVEFHYAKNCIGSVYIYRGGKLEWVMDVDGTTSQRKALYLLQPGNYKVVYREAKTRDTEQTGEKTFRIVSGAYENVSLD